MLFQENFIINGHKVHYSNGLAEFFEYKVLIRCLPSEFTYDWAHKMAYKLSVLRGII